jgi:hypothetical protein
MPSSQYPLKEWDSLVRLVAHEIITLNLNLEIDVVLRA